MKSKPRRSHSYCEGVMMFQRGGSMLFFVHLHSFLALSQSLTKLTALNISKPPRRASNPDHRAMMVSPNGQGGAIPTRRQGSQFTLLTLRQPELSRYEAGNVQTIFPPARGR